MRALKTIRKLAHKEEGAALVLAVTTLFIVSVLGAAALITAGGSINQTAWDRSSNQAFAIAEAGFDQAVARISNGDSGTGFTAQLLNGEAQVTITPLNMMMYRVKSVGAQPSLSAPKARRAVEAVIIHLDPKDVFFAEGAEGQMLGSTTFDGPLYVRDVLQDSGNSVFTTGPFFIKDDPATDAYNGDLLIQGSSSMGTVAEPIYLFVDGYYDPDHSGLFAEEVFTDVPDLTMPVIDNSDMPDQRAAADLVIDDDAVTNGTFEWPSSGSGVMFDKDTPDLTTSTVDGSLKWTKATKFLEIDGKVFIDGSVTFDVGNSSIAYKGTGTIIANGDIAVRSEFKPHDLTHWPDNDAVGFVSPDDMDLTAKANDEIYAFCYAYDKIYFSKSFYFYGNATSQLLETKSNPHITVQLNVDKSNMPPGMPEIDSFTSVTGWREVQP